MGRLLTHVTAAVTPALVVSTLFAASALAGAGAGAEPAGIVAGAEPALDVRLPDLGGQMVNPLQASSSTKATVVLFVSVDCPVSNRYAPEVIRLHDKFGPQGMAFWIVYPNPAESVATITRHLQEYRYPSRALRDPTTHSSRRRASR